MAYQPIEKPIPKYYNGKKVWGKRDCEDFKPLFFNRRYCKLSDECKKCGYFQDCYMINGVINNSLGIYQKMMNTFCTGIDKDRWQKIIS